MVAERSVGLRSFIAI